MSKHAKQQNIVGRVVAHNISPKGHVEGIRVATKNGHVQVNVPKHGAIDTAGAFAIGAHVSIAGEEEHGEGEHPVYAMAEEPGEIRGRVESINYARHGEVNGVILAGGVFVHLKPDGARRHELRVGDTIRASGHRIVGPAAVVIEAVDVVVDGVKERARASA